MTTCNACGFDNTPLDGEPLPEKCAGCGTPVRPSDDESPPAPGFEIPRRISKVTGEDEHGQPIYSGERQERYVVTDEDREEYESLENVQVILELQYEWGRGIGAEPMGYHVRSRVQIIEMEDPCPECGHEYGKSDFSQDAAGIAGGHTVECNACGHEVKDEFWC